jgi:hypothetical protein
MNQTNQTNNNEYEDTNDNVRDPDPVIRERLVDYGDNNDFSNYNYHYQKPDMVEDMDEDTDRILKQSLLDFELAEEQKIKDLIALERAERLQKYSNIKKRLQKVQGFDVKNKEIYNTIITIFELYETDFIDTYALDADSYNNVFRLLSTIRLTKEDLELLHELIYPPFYKG